MDLSNSNAEAVITIDDDDDDGDDDDDDDDNVIEEKMNHGNLEFSVREDKIKDISSLKETILALFGVTIKQDIRAKETDDKNDMRQWFSIVGPLDSCRQAKAFILATYDPGQAAIFEFDPMLHKILSNELEKTRIEKVSETLLLFGRSDEGSVVIQGVDEISIGVAMSLLEAAAYKASMALMSPNKEHQALNEKGNEIVAQGDQRRTESCARTDPVIGEDLMEVDINDLEMATGEVALDVMKSLDPEIQRLVKCGREKNYTDEEIREVLEKSRKIPKASDFFRALHTYRNLKAVSSESPVQQSSTSDVTMHSDFKLDFSSLQTKDSARKAKNEPTTVTGKNGTLDSELCEDIGSQRLVGTAEKKDIKIWDTVINPAKKDMHGDSVLSAKFISDLISISDAKERKRQAEANQQLNRKLFVEQSSAAASQKSYSYDRVTNLDEFSLPGDVNASDSGLDINTCSPSGRKRHKKKKKKDADLIAEENDYRSRSPCKPTESTSRSKSGQQTKEPNAAATATITQAGHLQSGQFSDSFIKNRDRVPQQIANAPISKLIPASITKPNSHALRPPFALEASRTAVSNQLRYVVIDGSNIAMTHGNGKFFSCRGIEIAVRHFRQRGHDEITVFVPQWRRQMPRFEDQNPIRDQDILAKLKDEGIMNFTPSRRIPGKRNIVCYDDRFILRLAQDTNGIVVSNDNYRDLYMDTPEWTEIIETRVLSYTFVGDRFMLPDDPLGREGPHLDEFLSLTRRPVHPSIHKNSLPLQLQHPAPNPRSQFERNPRFFAQQSSRAVVPVIPTAHWQPGHPNTGSRIRSPYAQDNEQWTNKINHIGIPIQTNTFPFRTSSAPFVSNLQQPSKFIVERVPSSPCVAAASPFHNQAASYPTNARQQHTKVSRISQSRSEAETKEIKCHLMEVFPDQEEQVTGLLSKNKTEKDLSLLIDLLLQEAEET